MYFIRILF